MSMWCVADTIGQILVSMGLACDCWGGRWLVVSGLSLVCLLVNLPVGLGKLAGSGHAESWKGGLAQLLNGLSRWMLNDE